MTEQSSFNNDDIEELLNELPEELKENVENVLEQMNELMAENPWVLLVATQEELIAYATLGTLNNDDYSTLLNNVKDEAFKRRDAGDMEFEDGEWDEFAESSSEETREIMMAGWVEKAMKLMFE